MIFVLLLNCVPLKASSPCSVNNGGCSHFCVAKTSGYECVCPTGLAVKQDGKTCKDSKKNNSLFQIECNSCFTSCSTVIVEM